MGSDTFITHLSIRGDPWSFFFFSSSVSHVVSSSSFQPHERRQRFFFLSRFAPSLYKIAKEIPLI